MIIEVSRVWKAKDRTEKITINYLIKELETWKECIGDAEIQYLYCKGNEIKLKARPEIKNDETAAEDKKEWT